MDTNVLSASAPSSRAASRARAAWFEAHGEELFLSAITVAEIEAGICKAERTGAATKARALRQWLDAIEHLYAVRILPFGIAEARRAGVIMDSARAHGPGFEDIAIAATAATHDLTVLTMNLRHFEPLGVPCRNPFETPA